jgi:hypothetical protein
MGNPAGGPAVSSDLDEYELKVLSNIEKSGCHVTTVFDPDGNNPSFSYSAGFTKSVGQPEVITFGLRHEVMHSMINNTLRQCERGLELQDFSRLTDLLEGFDVMVRAIPSEWIEREYFNSAMWFHRHEFGTDLTRAVQLVWPSSTTGLFPWEPNCHESVIAAQPALYSKSIH